MKKEKKIAYDVAITDVKAFAEYHLEKEIDLDKVVEDYPDLIEAVEYGLLTFTDNQVPTYVLKTPIGDGEHRVTELNIRTRIVASEQETIAKGIDMQKDMLRFINKMKATYIGQPKAMLDKFGNFDLRVIQQVTSVF